MSQDVPQSAVEHAVASLVRQDFAIPARLARRRMTLAKLRYYLSPITHQFNAPSFGGVRGGRRSSNISLAPFCLSHPTDMTRFHVWQNT